MNARPSVFLGFAAGVGIGAGGAFVYFQQTKGLRLEAPSASNPPVAGPSSTTSHPALKHGAPAAGDLMRHFDSYVASFDARASSASLLNHFP